MCLSKKNINSLDWSTIVEESIIKYKMSSGQSTFLFPLLSAYQSFFGWVNKQIKNIALNLMLKNQMGSVIA